MVGPARSPIRVLPPLLVNQIAAGEVVERPASVVKELLENALDAGATRIVVDLEGGGIDLVRVVDDGGGIPPEELPLALAPHATSKVRKPEDLDGVATMGFRGEALASIASVARVSVRSRTPDSDAAHTIEAEGDVVTAARPASGAVGTSVTVRTLFFNAPVRRRFLRTPATEQQRCAEVVREHAIGRPSIAFQLNADGRCLLDLSPGMSARERALELLGRELEPELIDVSYDQFDGAAGLTLWGLIGTPALARATARAQWVLINGRPIRDRSIQHALREGFRGLIEPSRHPTAVLLLEMDPTGVDVNVHPTKAEVRFRDPSLVHAAVSRAVRRGLQGRELTPTFTMASSGFRSGAAHPTAVAPSPAPIDSGAFVDYLRRFSPAKDDGTVAASPAAPVNSDPRGAPDQPAPAAPSMELPSLKPASRALQVHNSFIVTQDDQGIVIVDQHALHERVMFEALLARIAQGPLESQRLLTPAVVELDPTSLERLTGAAPLLARLGIEAEPISARAVGVHAFPTFLFDRGVEPGDVLPQILSVSEANSSVDTEEALRETLDMMACKAAVKAGDRLTETELAALLDLRESVDRSSNCPHGRPTSIRLTIRELERLFQRT